MGEDVENILLRLIQAADFDVERVERGIIYVDEIDKIARKSETPDHWGCFRARGPAGSAEDPEWNRYPNVPPQEDEISQQEFIQIDTSNILFICSGAFDGLERSWKRHRFFVVRLWSPGPFEKEPGYRKNGWARWFLTIW